MSSEKKDPVKLELRDEALACAKDAIQNAEQVLREAEHETEGICAGGARCGAAGSIPPNGTGGPVEGMRRIGSDAELPREILDYIELIESGVPRPCKEQKALAAYLRRIFDEEDLYIDEYRLGKYLSLEKYFPFDLFPWERAVVALWLCTFRREGPEEGTISEARGTSKPAGEAADVTPGKAKADRKEGQPARTQEAEGRPQSGPLQFVPRWDTAFAMVARGAGKDGLISFVSMCLTSPYNPVPDYDVDICANDEVQAMRPLKDLRKVLEKPKQASKLNRFFYHTKETIEGLRNGGAIHGWANNAKNRDGLRSGLIIFNEVHQYVNFDNISVFTSGHGKTGEPRVGIFSSNGKVNDGPLDIYLQRSMRILFEGEDDHGFLPFVCRLEREEQVHDPANWPMANPSWAYLPNLRKKTADQYEDWKEHPELNGDFLSKRMGLRKGFQELAVTDYDKILATNKPLPEMKGWSCVAGLDYAELNDWASAVLLFRRGEERIVICHTWICEQSKTLHRVRAPWQDWVRAGYCTLVHEPTIHPKLLGEWLMQAGRVYRLKKLAMDGYRWTLVSDAMIEAGFDAKDKKRVKLVRPSDIMKTEPVIASCFDRGIFTWGDCPPLRWAANNTKRIPSSRGIGSDTGNFYYGKIEAKSRKTDPFMALVAAMCVEEELPKTGAAISPPPVFVIS